MAEQDVNIVIRAVDESSDRVSAIGREYEELARNLAAIAERGQDAFRDVKQQVDDARRSVEQVDPATRNTVRGMSRELSQLMRAVSGLSGVQLPSSMVRQLGVVAGHVGKIAPAAAGASGALAALAAPAGVAAGIAALVGGTYALARSITNSETAARNWRIEIGVASQEIVNQYRTVGERLGQTRDQTDQMMGRWARSYFDLSRGTYSQLHNILASHGVAGMELARELAQMRAEGKDSVEAFERFMRWLAAQNDTVQRQFAEQTNIPIAVIKEWASASERAMRVFAPSAKERQDMDQALLQLKDKTDQWRESWGQFADEFKFKALQKIVPVLLWAMDKFEALGRFAKEQVLPTLPAVPNKPVSEWTREDYADFLFGPEGSPLRGGKIWEEPDWMKRIRGAPVAEATPPEAESDELKEEQNVYLREMRDELDRIKDNMEKQGQLSNPHRVGLPGEQVLPGAGATGPGGEFPQGMDPSQAGIRPVGTDKQWFTALGAAYGVSTGAGLLSVGSRSGWPSRIVQSLMGDEQTVLGRLQARQPAMRQPLDVPGQRGGAPTTSIFGAAAPPSAGPPAATGPSPPATYGEGAPPPLQPGTGMGSETVYRGEQPFPLPPESPTMPDLNVIQSVLTSVPFSEASALFGGEQRPSMAGSLITTQPKMTPDMMSTPGPFDVSSLPLPYSQPKTITPAGGTGVGAFGAQQDTSSIIQTTPIGLTPAADAAAATGDAAAAADRQFLDLTIGGRPRPTDVSPPSEMPQLPDVPPMPRRTRRPRSLSVDRAALDRSIDRRENRRGGRWRPTASMDVNVVAPADTDVQVEAEGAFENNVNMRQTKRVAEEPAAAEA